MSTSPAPADPSILEEVRRILADNDVEISDILLSVLKSEDEYLSPARSNLLRSTQYLTCILDQLAGPEGNPSVDNIRAAHQFMRRHYAEEICRMSQIGKGYHYRAKAITPERLAAFSIDMLAKDIKKSMPLLWNLFHCLLDANPHRRKSGESGTEESGRRDGEHILDRLRSDLPNVRHSAKNGSSTSAPLPEALATLRNVFEQLRSDLPNVPLHQKRLVNPNPATGSVGRARRRVGTHQASLL
ncbi:hypothetical protein M407DRAFT_26138 [Tulasnella calospora MUT 4182]|uniref:Uncharacterized protein n=1 Tax=Tulasnella calospora MUT 4182 TaxID=1051891 RepID=A0A0C3LSU1_9AGAM|nr:hypothetical protein M407DRAFT_26138 [Tulasnella calospora MUT 4182]